jgi:dihydroorotate dehydrogenase
MPIEKDFSPTLAGSSLASQKEKILEWLRRIPELIRRAVGPGGVRVGLKIFNAMFDDEFQLEMLDVAHAAGGRADFLIYANRLFDPAKEFEGKVGVAYGGPDLSDRNLRVLERWPQRRGASAPLPMSATGDIGSGKMAVEYLRRGASSFQIHTYFQLPDGEYAMGTGPKTARALHQLYFHPESGFIPWLCHLRRERGWPEIINVKEAAERCAHADG